MKKTITLAVSFFIVLGAWAQNTVFTYQGRVTDNGTNFTGAGQFKFAITYVTNISSQATAIATSINLDGGALNGINLTYGGSGYVAAPAVTITPSEGGTATATTTISGGSVISINITSGSCCYSALPSVSIAPPPADYVNATLWSNDGTTSGEPAVSVNVQVVNGLFTVTLGDTTLTNMIGIPANLFATTNTLQLKIWFNDGVNGFTSLSPLQNLTPAPLATYASFANAASNLLGQLPTSQLTGTFTGNGSGLTSLNAANLTGSIPTASLASVPAASLTGVIAQADLGTNNSYTPTIGDGTHNFTTTTQAGYYTVVGNLVHVEIWLQWNSKGSATSTSAVQISLPYPVVTSRAAFSIGYFSGLTYSNQLLAGANNGASSLFLDSASNSGGAATGLTVNSCGTGGELQIVGTYRWK